jgi:hypothetical protein
MDSSIQQFDMVKPGLPQEIVKATAQWWMDRFQIEDKKQDFYQAVIKHLPEGDDWKLWTDYDPKDELLDAVQEVTECRGYMWSCSGILPQHCMMQFYNGILRAYQGYGAHYVELARVRKS